VRDTLRAVRGLHMWLGIAVIATNAVAFGWGAYTVWRKRVPGRLFQHVLALAQTLVIAQIALGLLLLSDGSRTTDDLHYAYGVFALLAVLSPWFYAPEEPRKRLAWFAGATLIATALSIRAYTTSG
jgi:drug/metabolite transporter (DMT)-like permease